MRKGLVERGWLSTPRNKRRWENMLRIAAGGSHTLLNYPRLETPSSRDVRFVLISASCYRRVINPNFCQSLILSPMDRADNWEMWFFFSILIIDLTRWKSLVVRKCYKREFRWIEEKMIEEKSYDILIVRVSKRDTRMYEKKLMDALSVIGFLLYITFVSKSFEITSMKHPRWLLVCFEYNRTIRSFFNT